MTAKIVGVLQQAKGLPDARDALVVDEDGRVWRWVERAAGLTTAGWVEVRTYQGFRESGDSISDVEVRDMVERANARIAAERQPPVLNKSGGSDVDDP